MMQFIKGSQKGCPSSGGESRWLTEALDGLTVQEAARLQEGIDAGTFSTKGKRKFARRIGRRTMEMAGLSPQKREGSRWKRRGTGAVAVLASLLLTLSLVGLDTTALAIQRLFHLIPGLGISYSETGRAYLALPVEGRIQEGNRTVRLLHAFYSDGWLQISLSLGDSALREAAQGTAQEQLEGVSSGPLMEAECRLWVDGQEASGLQSRRFGSFSQVQAELYFPVEEEQLSVGDTLYEVQVEGMKQRLAFRLTPCEGVEDLSQLGAVAEQGGIAVAAQVAVLPEGVEVSCYPVDLLEGREYASISVGADGMAYAGERVWLEVDGRRLDWSQEGIHRRNTFLFPTELLPGQTPVLHIPYLTVKTEEEQLVTLPLPQGEREALEQTVAFAGGQLRLVEIQRETAPETGSPCWKLTVQLSGSEEEVVFQSLSADLLDRQGNLMDRADLAYDGDGVLTTLWLGETGEGQLRIAFRQPSYFLTGSYQIPLELPER